MRPDDRARRRAGGQWRNRREPALHLGRQSGRLGRVPAARVRGAAPAAAAPAPAPACRHVRVRQVPEWGGVAGALPVKSAQLRSRTPSSGGPPGRRLHRRPGAAPAQPRRSCVALLRDSNCPGLAPPPLIYRAILFAACSFFIDTPFTSRLQKLGEVHFVAPALRPQFCLHYNSGLVWLKKTWLAGRIVSLAQLVVELCSVAYRATAGALFAAFPVASPRCNGAALAARRG
eukprot:COSAG04_NODE_601_length_12210_cov_5.548510_9_plen_231_part_00